MDLAVQINKYEVTNWQTYVLQQYIFYDLIINE